MKAFIEILREKYGLAQPEAEKLLEQMELMNQRLLEARESPEEVEDWPMEDLVIMLEAVEVRLDQ